MAVGESLKTLAARVIERAEGLERSSGTRTEQAPKGGTRKGLFVPPEPPARKHVPRSKGMGVEQRNNDSRVGPWQPPGAVQAPRACPRCKGGLQPADADNSVCSSCRAYFEIVKSRRVN